MMQLPLWQPRFKRVAQALRSLEEYGKVISPPMGAGFEQLRYRVYTLERAVGLTASSIERLANTRLCVLIDGRSSLAEFAALTKSLVDAGVGILQLRDKKLSDREMIDRGTSASRADSRDEYNRNNQ